MKYILLIYLGLLIGQGVSWADDSIPIQTIALEARGEGLIGQVAVGEVIRNRAATRCRMELYWGEMSLLEAVRWVCLEPSQFSCWNDRKQALIALKGVSGEEYQRAGRAWAESEQMAVLGEGYTHYHEKSILPHWAVGKKGKRISNHVFYRGIK